MVIKLFGGDFEEVQEILVVDKINCFDSFKNTYESGSKYLEEYTNTKIVLYEDDINDIEKIVSEEDKVVLIIEKDDSNYVRAKIISNEELGTITSTLISTSLNSIRSNIVLVNHNISTDVYNEINGVVEIEKEILDSDNLNNNIVAVTVMQIVTMPLFILIVFLIQMIGAEINDEKSTKSMEIIISNVSPKTHFLSKVLSSNLFVI